MSGVSNSTAYSFIKDLGSSAVSGSLAATFVFPGFITKSMQQTSKPLPFSSLITVETLKKSCTAGPIIGSVIATQMVAQNITESLLKREPNENPNFTNMFFGAMTVSVVSVPPLAIFNGKTLGKTAFQSLRLLSLGQFGAILTRELSFLFFLRISGPISEKIEQLYGENKVVKYTSLFGAGAIGSLIGHPADTALTLWQNNMKITGLRQLMQGGLTKAMTVGMFSVLYNFTKKNLTLLETKFIVI